MKDKLIFYTGSLYMGGAERVIAFLATEFSRDYEVEIICHYHYPRFYEVPQSVKVIDLETDWNCKSFQSKAKSVRQYIKGQDQGKAVLITFMMPFFIFTGFVLLGLKIPVIAAERSNPFKESFIRRSLTKLLEKRFSAVVVQSKGAAEFYKHSKRVEIIHNPIKADFQWW